MKHQRKKRKKIRPQEIRPVVLNPSTWTFRERLSVTAALIVAVGVFTGAEPLSEYFSNRNQLAARLAKWKDTYHLTDVQIAQLREIEIQFHGNGNPFTAPGHPTHEESERHHQNVDAILGQGSGGDSSEEGSSPTPREEPFLK